MKSNIFQQIRQMIIRVLAMRRQIHLQRHKQVTVEEINETKDERIIYTITKDVLIAESEATFRLIILFLYYF